VTWKPPQLQRMKNITPEFISARCRRLIIRRSKSKRLRVQEIRCNKGLQGEKCSIGCINSILYPVPVPHHARTTFRIPSTSNLNIFVWGGIVVREIVHAESTCPNVVRDIACATLPKSVQSSWGSDKSPSHWAMRRGNSSHQMGPSGMFKLQRRFSVFEFINCLAPRIVVQMWITSASTSGRCRR